MIFHLTQFVYFYAVFIKNNNFQIKHGLGFKYQYNQNININLQHV